MSAGGHGAGRGGGTEGNRLTDQREGVRADLRRYRTRERVDEAAVANVPTTVSVAWRPAPEGPRLTFLERSAGADTIYERREDLGAVERLVGFDNRVSGRFGSFDWHPDGGIVAYVRGGDLRVYDLKTATERIVAGSDTFDGPPRWSPSGDRLAFVSDRGKVGTDVWMVDVEGG